MAEFQASLAHGWVVDDWEKACRVGHEHPIEQRLVGIQEPHQVDIAFEVRGLMAEVHDALNLHVFRIDGLRHESDQRQRLTFRLGEGGGLVQAGSWSN
jgi:hypothetical protein